jgi:hypothetical protein
VRPWSLLLNNPRVLQTIEGVATQETLAGRQILAATEKAAVTEARVSSTVQTISKNEPITTAAVEAKIPANTQVGINDAVIAHEGKLFNFTETTAKHMNDAKRMVPIHTLESIVKSPMAVVKDPRGASNAMMHYSQIWKNDKLYNIEVLYDKSTDTILHFRYSKNAMGPLEKVSK